MGPDEPDNLRPFFDRPGREWIDDEAAVDAVNAWLYAPAQQAALRAFFASRVYTATDSDADEAWQDYWPANWRTVIRNYDPSKGSRFRGFLLVCYGNWISKRGPKLTRNRDKHIGLDDLPIQLVADGPSADDGALLKEKIRAVQHCLNRLHKNLRWVVFHRLLQGKSVAQTAALLGISDDLVKVRLHRALPALQKCLEKRGVIG